jgi:hypothetical protein
VPEQQAAAPAGVVRAAERFFCTPKR